MKRGLLLLAAVLLTHVGYHYLPIDESVGRPESWSFYILRGVEGCILFLLVMRSFCNMGSLGAIGVYACWYGFMEEAETAICGATASHDIRVPQFSNLCTEQIGHFPFQLVASVALATILVKPWEKKNGRT